MNDARFDNLAKLVARRLSRRGALLGLGAAAASLGLKSIDAGAASKLPELHYFALGDSIAAGHGLGDDDGPEPNVFRLDYDGGTCADCDGSLCKNCTISGCGPCVDPGCAPLDPMCDPNHCRACPPEADQNWACRPCCRRSSRSYPDRVKKLLAPHFGKVTLHHYACTGATSLTADHLKIDVPFQTQLASRTPMRLLRAQVDLVLDQLTQVPAGAPVLVSITIGANDFQFGGSELLYQLYWNSETEFDKWASKRAVAVHDEVKSLVQSLLGSKHVSVVLTEVHNPFNKASVFFTGENACLDKKCWDRTDRGVRTLNKHLRQVVDELAADVSLDAAQRVALAEIHDEFEKHRAPSPTCGDDPPKSTSASDNGGSWIQYRNDSKSTSFAVPGMVGLTYLSREQLLQPAYVSLLELVAHNVQQGVWRGDCFHPNDDGAAYIASQVAAATSGLLGPHIVDGPYVGQVTDAAATITWTTNVAATGTVDYGLTADFGQSAANSSSRVHHKIVLSGLTPGTTYHYRVRSADSAGEAVTKRGRTFTTAAISIIQGGGPCQSGGGCASDADCCDPSEACVDGACGQPGDGNPGGACAQGQSLCPDGCANLSSDINNCGGCGNVCESTQFCVASSCTVTPPDGGPIVLPGDGAVTITDLTVNGAICISAFGLSAPEQLTIFTDSHAEVGQSFTIGPYPAGTELVFWLQPQAGSVCTTEAYLSSDLDHARVTSYGDSWVINWEDLDPGLPGADDFLDLIVNIDFNPVA